MSNDDRFEYIRRHGSAPPEDWNTRERSPACYEREIARLSKERNELLRTGRALSNLLNAGGRYVDGRGFKGPELTAFDKALATKSES